MDQSEDKPTRVLIVEDEFLIAMDILSTVEQLGYSPVGPAASVAAALAILEQEPPDLALLDETLKGESVAPVATKLSEEGIPFVIVSGHIRSVSDDPILQAARRLEKPVTKNRLREVLASLPQPRRR